MGFDLDERAPQLGQFRINFKPDASDFRKWAVGNYQANYPGWHFDTICVTPQRIRDPGITRATVLANAVFSGMVEDAEYGSFDEPWSVSGPSIVAMLGNGSSPSLGPCGFASGGSVSLATFLVALFGGGTTPGAYTNGLTLNSAATCSGNTIDDDATGAETARQLIERWQRQTTDPTEWWCNPAGSCKFAVEGNTAVFTQTPTVMFARGVPRGTFAQIECFPTTFKMHHSWRDLAYEVIMDDGAGSLVASSVTATDGGTFDPAIEMDAMYGGGGANGGRAAYYRGDGAGVEAGALLEGRHRATRNGHFNVSAKTDAYCLASYIKPGDYAYIHDRDTYIDSTSAEIIASGRIYNPASVRLVSMDCPIKPGMGVYRLANGSGTGPDFGGSWPYWTWVEDITDRILFADKTAETTLEFDAASPSLRRQLYQFTRPNENTASFR